MDRNVGQVVSFERESVNDYIGKEFYLLIQKGGFTDNMNETRMKRGLQWCKQLGNFLGINPTPRNQTEVHFIELYQKGSFYINGYRWALPDIISFENGDSAYSKLNEKIGTSYLFVPEEIECNKKLILTGIIQKWGNRENKINKPLEDKVVVTFNKIPSKKTCFGIDYS
jgi:hypothetical protein